MRSSCVRMWFLLAVWLLAAAHAGAAPAAPAATVSIGMLDHYNLSHSVQWLQDDTKALTIDDILQPAQQARFVQLEQQGPGANFGLTKSAIWMKLQLKAEERIAPDWLFEVGYPPLDRVELYTSTNAAAASGWQRQVAGDLLPYHSRVIPHRNHVLPVSIPAGSSATFYIRVMSEGTVSAPLHLWRTNALWAHDQGSYAALSLYFGLLAGLLLYNLLLFISVQDLGYLIYVAFAGAMGVGQAAITGVGGQFLWPEAVWWNSVSPPVGMTATAIFGLMFARHFLSSRVRLPRLDKLMLVLMAGWLAAMAAAIALPYRYSSWMVTTLAVVSVAAMVALGVISVRRQFAGARFFFTAWAVLLVGVFTLVLHNIGFIPSNPFTTNALLIGSAAEMVLLSFALADRINVARRFKEQAQARIAAEHAMVQALSQSQDRLRTVLEEREIILESSIVGIAFLTPSGRFKWANKAMTEIFGTDGRQVSSMEPFYLDREQYLQVGGEVARAVEAGEIFEKELQMRRTDGTRLWVSLSGKAVSRTDLGQGTVWVIMDITRRKELEEQLQRTMAEREAERRKSEEETREALEQQRALNDLRTRFVAMTSHELRTPLAAIMSAEELLRHYGERLSATERTEVLDSIASGVQRMSRMMDRVLLLGRADAKMLDYEPRPLDLRQLCRELADEARALDKAGRCELTCGLDGVGEGEYDEKLLRHIFGNLLSNAIKYSPGGGKVRFDVHCNGQGETVFEVADEGIGIPPHEVPHLFESFHRASNVGAIPGTGLGLAIVKNAVQAHGGTIEVESALGEGTRFTVRVPQ